MSKVAHTNETRNFQHIGGVTVPPGETREVEASLLPGYQAEAPPDPEEPEDLLAELLKASVKNIVPELAGMSDQDLTRAESQEQAGLNRKSMLSAISEEFLRRAAKDDELSAGAPTGNESDAGAATGNESVTGAPMGNESAAGTRTGEA